MFCSRSQFCFEEQKQLSQLLEVLISCFRNTLAIKLRTCCSCVSAVRPRSRMANYGRSTTTTVFSNARPPSFWPPHSRYQANLDYGLSKRVLPKSQRPGYLRRRRVWTASTNSTPVNCRWSYRRQNETTTQVCVAVYVCRMRDLSLTQSGSDAANVVLKRFLFLCRTLRRPSCKVLSEIRPQPITMASVNQSNSH